MYRVALLWWVIDITFTGAIHSFISEREISLCVVEKIFVDQTDESEKMILESKSLFKICSVATEDSII